MKSMYVLVASLFLMMNSCAHIQYRHERSRLPRASFVEIMTTVSTKDCSAETCVMNIGESVSSGSIIHVDASGA